MNSGKKGFLLIENPTSIKTIIELFVNRLISLKNSAEKLNICILTHLEHNFKFFKRIGETNYTIDIYKNQCSALKISNQKIYYFFEAYDKLYKYTYDDENEYCVFATEFSTIPELQAVSIFFDSKYKNCSLFEQIQYCNKIGKKIKIQKLHTHVTLSKIAIKYTPELYSQYIINMSELREYTEKNAIEVANSTVPHLMSAKLLSKHLEIYSPKIDHLVKSCKNGKHIVFTRFKRIANLCNEIFKIHNCSSYLYSDWNTNESNFDNWIAWLQKNHGILCVSVNEYSPFWTYNLGSLNSIKIFECYNDNYINLCGQIAYTNTKHKMEISNYFNAEKYITLDVLAYVDPYAEELIEDEFYRKFCSVSKERDIVIHLLKNGCGEEFVSEYNNVFKNENLLKSDYQRVFGNGLTELKIEN